MKYEPTRQKMKEITGKRVSQDAVKRMQTFLEDQLYALTEATNRYTEHADRKTVKLEDIEAAIQEDRTSYAYEPK